MLELKHHCACVRKIQYKGVCRETNTASRHPPPPPPPPSTVFFVHTSKYFLVIWLGVIFSSTQTVAIFGHQDISKCSYNLFLVVERTNRISLASFRDIQCHACDQSCCLGGVVFKKLCDQTISKCLYNLFLAVERTRRISLAGFSDLQCVVYITFRK